MRIKDNESDLATNLLLGLFALALVAIAGNGIAYSGKHHTTFASTHAAIR
jgi:hypothetical protein